MDNKNKKIALRPETSLANVGNQIAITNKILKSIKDIQLPVFGTFTDPHDGNVYKTVKIGEQVWMAENLRYIPHVCPADEQGGIWVYGYNGHEISQAKATDNYKVYGCLYNWEKAKSACPFGWHLPTDNEWKTLLYSHGDVKFVGGKLKSLAKWESPNLGATNEFGFSALPGGGRSFRGSFILINFWGNWWISNSCVIFLMDTTIDEDFDVGWSGGNNDMDVGYSVRCVMDSLTI
jgi:uncharacterized protein (TIGR02145 family)